VTGDSSRAAWLRQARSYLRNADPVLARLIDDQLPVLRRLRAGRSTTDRPTREHWNMNGGTHPDPIHNAHRSRLGPASCGNHVTKEGPK
jgi:hypothetical protein